MVHNASFEREVLGRHGFVLEGVVDNRDLSRQRHGADAGHSLREACPHYPSWELRWDSDVSVLLPLGHDHLAHKARALVLGLGRR